MGPINLALYELQKAETNLREAEGRLASVTRNVRVQERKLADLTDKLQQQTQALREKQTQASQLELEIKSRDERIERLRLQQQAAKNNKEYQAFLIEINTEKVDKSKTEDEAMKVMEEVEQATAAVDSLKKQVQTEQQSLGTMQSQINDKVQVLKAEIGKLRPIRQEAAAKLPSHILDTFDRLADRYDGEVLSPLGKPDRRREEYICGGCQMSLVVDVYNRLHTRDELVYCTSCGRILVIPPELTPEAAINKKAVRKTRAPKAEPTEEVSTAKEHETSSTAG